MSRQPSIEAAEALPADVFVPGYGFLPRDPKTARPARRRHWQILHDVREAVREQVSRGAEIAIHRIHRELTVGLP